VSLVSPGSGSQQHSGEALGAKLGDRLFGLSERQAHAFEHPSGLGELDLVVLHDLDAVAERVTEFEATTGQDVGLRRLERAPGGLLVVDDEAEVPLLTGAGLEQGDELIADVDEGREIRFERGETG